MNRQTLSIGYRRLVIMRFLLNKESYDSREALDNAIAGTVIDKSFLRDLAEDVSESINERKGDNPCFGVTSLGRWLGAYATETNITKNNLDRIAKYLLCDNWSQLTRFDEELIEERILRHNEFALAEELISRANDSAESSMQTGLQRLLARNLLKGQKVEVHYGVQRRIVLKKLSQDDRFKVEACDSKILAKGMCITIQALFLGVNLTGIDVTLNGKDVKTFYKSGGPIKSIRIISDGW